MRRPHRSLIPLVALLLAATTTTGSADSGSAPGQQPPSSTAAPTISGTAQQGQTLSATTGSWKGVAVSYAYQWKRCDLAGNACVAIAGATTSAYKLAAAADVGATIRIAVTGTNKNGSATATSVQTPVVAPAPAPPPAAPTNSSPPAISGTAQAGQTLSASTGSWSGSPTSYAYQWQRCDSSGGSCASLSGATGSSYLLVSGDVGSTMRVVVSAKNAGGTGSATSAATGLVAATPTLQAPASTAPPQISGTAQAGQTLSTSNGSWSGSPTGYSYQWKRCDSTGASCVAISGATASSYLLAAGDVASTLRVTVTATNGAGTGTATSAQTAAVAAAPAKPANTALPLVSGTAQAGQTLSASTGTWSGSPTSYAYQWSRCDSAGANCAGVSGATTSTYALAAADVNFTMRVAVSATNGAGTSTATSAQTALVAAAPSKPVSTALPAISGTAQAGQTLTVSNGTWSGSPTAYAYQWSRCDNTGANCVAIAGATAKTFTLTSTDVGKTLRAAVTASNSAGSTSATSAQSGLVAAPPATSKRDQVGANVPNIGPEAIPSTWAPKVAADTGLSLFRTDGAVSATYGSTTPNWTYMDRVVSFVKAVSGAKVLLAFWTAPDWMHPGVSGYRYPPDSAHYQAWANCVLAMVDHMVAAGVAVPEIELWNEPWLDAFWAPKPNPTVYLQLTKVTAATLWAKYPNLKIGVSADYWQQGTGSGQQWWGQVLAADTSGFLNDARIFLTTHNYVENASPTTVRSTGWSFDRYKLAHDQAVAHGKANPQVEITEYGWRDGVDVDAQTQANYTIQAAQMALATGYVTRVFVFEDYPGETWGYNMHYSNGTPRPVATAMKTYVSQ